MVCIPFNRQAIFQCKLTWIIVPQNVHSSFVFYSKPKWIVLKQYIKNIHIYIFLVSSNFPSSSIFCLTRSSISCLLPMLPGSSSSLSCCWSERVYSSSWILKQDITISILYLIFLKYIISYLISMLKLVNSLQFSFTEFTVSILF